MDKRTLWMWVTAVTLWTGMSIAQENKAVTADRHVQQHNISCAGCHGKDQPKAVTQEACLTCHKSLETVAERTKDFNYNPHRNHLTRSGEVGCLQCHQGHKEDQLPCLKCHDGLVLQRRK